MVWALVLGCVRVRARVSSQNVWEEWGETEERLTVLWCGIWEIISPILGIDFLLLTD